MITDQDLLWLAGYLEGEGTFNLAGAKNKAGMYTSIQIVVSSVDLDIITKVAKLWERNVYTIKPYTYAKSFQGAKQTQYRTNLTGMSAVFLMRRLYPFMGIRRQGQIRRALQNSPHVKRLISEESRVAIS